MKTRRFKALNGVKGKYSRIVDKIAIYDEIGNQIDCCVIQKDDEGREYYYPSNPNDTMGLFLHRPKDAVECIRKGFGDGFQVNKLFGFKLEHVVKFIDRKYGDEIRKKTIDGWKNTQFAYGVMFSLLNSFDGGREVCKNKSLFGWHNKIEDILTFDSEEDASVFIKDVMDKATVYHNEYMKLKDLETENHDEYYENVYKPFFNNIKGRKENGLNSIYWNVFYALNEEKREEKKVYKMEVIQIVLPA